jgi:hypothetical protein
MNLDKYLVITGVPGVHKLISTRTNGLVIEDRKEGRTRFVPVRQQQVTPLATVSVYTENEEGMMPLADVFQKMLDLHDSTPPVPVDSQSEVLRTYFLTVLPEHDTDQVRITDIKKCIKWYNFMVEKGIFDEIKRAETTEPEPDTQEAEPESALTDAEADAPTIDKQAPEEDV